MMKSFLMGLFLCVGLTACASVDYAAPDPADETVELYQQDMQREAIDLQLARRARLYDLAWPVLKENVALCTDTKTSIGVILAGRQELGAFVGGIDEDYLTRLGYADDINVLHAMAGSPAAEAGLKPGMALLAVDGEEIETRQAEAAIAAIVAALDEDERVTLTVRDEAGTRDVTIKGVETCAAPVKMSTSDAINAMAATGDIVIHAGMMRAADDDTLQFVIAHELAHIALAHRPKVIRNSIVSGAVVYGPVLYVGGMVADTVLRLTGSQRSGSLSSRALAASVPYMNEFEAEADYVGLYMLARAGGNIDAAPELFTLFATEKPESTWLLYTHPLTPQRYAAVEAAVSEVKAKIAAGEELLPEKAE